MPKRRGLTFWAEAWTWQQTGDPPPLRSGSDARAPATQFLHRRLPVIDSRALTCVRVSCEMCAWRPSGFIVGPTAAERRSWGKPGMLTRVRPPSHNVCYSAIVGCFPLRMAKCDCDSRSARHGRHPSASLPRRPHVRPRLFGAGYRASPETNLQPRPERNPVLCCHSSSGNSPHPLRSRPLRPPLTGRPRAFRAAAHPSQSRNGPAPGPPRAH